jgi:trans-aconitate methyltransferase
MISRPTFYSNWNAVRFQDQSVVDRYHLRPTYPPQTFEILNELIKDEPRVVLDVGCGTGNITRPLAPFVERIDAIDWSQPMLERARTLLGGNAPNIHWLPGRAENVQTQPPYALITAGESLHWMEWSVVLPRLAREVSPRGMLAILYVEEQSNPWEEGYRQIVRRFSNNPTYRPFDWIAELEKYQLFQQLGERRTTPVSMQQTVGDYVAAQHARSSLSLETMTAEQATQFDTEMQALLSPFAQDGLLTLSIVGGIRWGRPKGGEGG